MSGKPEDISHIAKAILAGDDSKKHISELAKLTAKQIYAQGYQAGEAADKKDVWNEAIEVAYRIASETTPYADEILKLKK